MNYKCTATCILQARGYCFFYNEDKPLSGLCKVARTAYNPTSRNESKQRERIRQITAILRDRGSAYAPQVAQEIGTHRQEANYYLFIMMQKGLVKVEIKPNGTGCRKLYSLF